MVSEPRAAQARRFHQESIRAGQAAERAREQRDRLVRALREEDPQVWSYAALAGAVGCSPELIAKIIRPQRR